MLISTIVVRLLRAQLFGGPLFQKYFFCQKKGKRIRLNFGGMEFHEFTFQEKKFR
jgi:hypothetical protein